MNEELDSQLSAMFDNELPAAECELLARRLSRDEDLKGRWRRDAAIGATLRAQGGLRVNSDPPLADAAGWNRSGCQRRRRLDPVLEVRVTDVAGCAVAACNLNVKSDAR